ncbi:unnamed protein product, partial [Laminaria digitata]
SLTELPEHHSSKKALTIGLRVTETAREFSCYQPKNTEGHFEYNCTEDQDEASVFESGLIKPLGIVVLLLRLQHGPVGAAHVSRAPLLRCVGIDCLLGNVFFCPTLPWSEGAAPVPGGSWCFNVSSSMDRRPEVDSDKDPRGGWRLREGPRR